MNSRVLRAAVNMIARLADIDINEQLRLENEYLRNENQVLTHQFNATGKRLVFTDDQRRELAIKAKALGQRGYLRIAGAIENLGHTVSKSTVKNILKRNGLNPSGQRKCGGMTWAEFIAAHIDVLWATDFFTCEVWTKFGLVTHYALLFIHIGTRRVVLGGITDHPNGKWMTQIARNLSGYDGELINGKYLIHDRDAKYTLQFDEIMKSAGIKPIRLPPRSPNLNAFCERVIQSVQKECSDKLIFVGTKSLRRAIREWQEHYHHERNHQGLENQIPFPDENVGKLFGKVKCRKRLGGLLKYYYRDAA